MFIGNTIAYNRLIKWLKEPLPTMLDASCILVIQGISGSGKTHGITRAIEECDMRACKLDDADVKQSLVKMTSSDIVAQFTTEPRKRKVLFIDDFEMYLSMNRSFMNILTSMFGSILPIKIVIAAVSFDTKWTITVVKLVLISDADIIVYLRTHFPELQPANILDIVQTSKGNLGAAIQSAITLGSKNDEVPVAKDMYTCTNPESIFTIMEMDSWLMPLRYHENIIHELQQRKGVASVKNKLLIQFLKAICEWDVMMTQGKRLGVDNHVALWYISCVIAHMNRVERKKRSEEVEDNFTRLFNTLSLRKKRKVASYQSVFPWDNVSGFYRELVSKKFSERSISAKHGRVSPSS
jgi:hypothetical protein